MSGRPVDAVDPSRQVHLVVPGDIDDPTAPSGGNTYDRELGQGLAAAGWSVREYAVPGSWPHPTAADHARLAGALAGMPDGATGLLDGLVACAAPATVRAECGRLRLVALVHLPLGDETGLHPRQAARLHAREGRTLRAVTAVIATSGWAARRLVERHRLPRHRVHVAPPGVGAAPLAAGTDGGSNLLCVAAVTPRKGQDLLVEALARLPDRCWSCVCVGGLARAPGYVDRVRARTGAYGLAERVRLVGPRTGADLAGTYAAADLVVLPSHAETYGMVVTEALARGIPVVATDVGGVSEALGRTTGGAVPGMLVPPADPAALAGALGHWLDDAATRHRLRRAARARRRALPDWPATVRAVSRVLDGVAPDARSAA